MTSHFDPLGFANRWGTGIKPLVFRPKPFLPNEASRFLYEDGFPTFFRLNSYWEIRFDRECFPLSITWQRIQRDDWKMPHAWNAFWKIGDIEFDQATAWLVIEELTGRILVVDPEVADDPVSELSSSPIRFAHCMLLYKECAGNIGPRAFFAQCRQQLISLSKNVVFNDTNTFGFWFPFLVDVGDNSSKTWNEAVIEIQTG